MRNNILLAIIFIATICAANCAPNQRSFADDDDDDDEDDMHKNAVESRKPKATWDKSKGKPFMKKLDSSFAALKEQVNKLPKPAMPKLSIGKDVPYLVGGHLLGGFSTGAKAFQLCIFSRILLSWIQPPPMSLILPLASITNPYLGIFRGLIPPFGGWDFSPMVAIYGLSFAQVEAEKASMKMHYQAAMHRRGNRQRFERYRPTFATMDLISRPKRDSQLDNVVDDAMGMQVFKGHFVTLIFSFSTGILFIFSVRRTSSATREEPLLGV